MSHVWDLGTHDSDRLDLFLGAPAEGVCPTAGGYLSKSSAIAVIDEALIDPAK